MEQHSVGECDSQNCQIVKIDRSIKKITNRKKRKCCHGFGDNFEALWLTLHNYFAFWTIAFDTQLIRLIIYGKPVLNEKNNFQQILETDQAYMYVKVGRYDV